MSRLLTAFTLLASCAFAQTRVISFHIKNLDSQPAEIVESAHKELRRVLDSLDVSIRWQGVRPGADEEALLVVVTLAGSCSLTDYIPQRNAALQPGLPLASTAVVDGKVLPFVTVECNRLRHRIGAEVVGLRVAERNTAFGKAIGRVLAHEVYHVLTGDTKHAREGIAAACVSVRNLLADDFTLDAESLAQMAKRSGVSVKSASAEILVADDPEPTLIESSIEVRDAR